MTIPNFTGPYHFLSNFYVATVKDEFGTVWPTSEHMFQAHKTFNLDERAAMTLMPTPGQAKRLGRKLTLRPDWEDIKVQIMWDVVSRKFNQHEDLQALLVSTEPHKLIEGNTWGDTYWGVCNGVGQNHLGRLLMGLRYAYIHNLNMMGDK